MMFGSGLFKSVSLKQGGRLVYCSSYDCLTSQLGILWFVVGIVVVDQKA